MLNEKLKNLKLVVDNGKKLLVLKVFEKIFWSFILENNNNNNNNKWIKFIEFRYFVRDNWYFCVYRKNGDIK